MPKRWVHGKWRVVRNAYRNSRYLRFVEYTCAYPECGTKARDAHHIVPLSVGGLDVFRNLVSLCAFHHRFMRLHSRWEDHEVQLAVWKHMLEFETCGHILDVGDEGEPELAMPGMTPRIEVPALEEKKPIPQTEPILEPIGPLNWKPFQMKLFK